MSQFNDDQNKMIIDSIDESYRKVLDEHHQHKLKLVNAIYEIKKHTQLIEHLDILLNMLDMAPVIIRLHYHKDKIVILVIEKKFYHKHLNRRVV